MANTLCCCCFSNNVRHLVLCLLVVSSTSLFANLLLFNVTVVYRPDIQFSSHTRQLDSLEHPAKRAVRQSGFEANATELGDGSSSLVVPDEGTYVSENSTIIEDIAAFKHSDPAQKYDHTDGHPVVPPEYDTPKVSPTTPTTTSSEKPKTVFFTRTPPKPAEKLTIATSTSTARSTTSVTPSTEKDATNWPSVGTGDKDLAGISHSKLDDLAKPTDSMEGSTEATEETSALLNEEIHEKVKTLLLWISPGIGMVCGTLLAIWLMKPVGARKLLAAALISSALSTLGLAFTIPSRRSHYFTIAARLVQGLAFGCVFPVVGSLTANWATLKEQFFFIVWSNLFIPLAPTVSWPIIGLIAKNSLGVLCILHAGVALLVALIWTLFYRDRPQYHPWVNGLELNKIVTGKIKALTNRSDKRNTCSLLVSSFPVWAIWVSSLCYFIAIALVVQYLPVYCRYFLDHHPPRLFYLTALFFLLMSVLMMLYPLWFRLSKMCGEKTSVMFFTVFSFVLSGAVFVFVAITPPQNSYYSALFVCAPLLLALALSFYGFYRSAVLVGRFFTQFIFSYSQICMGLAFVFVPVLVFFFDRPGGINEWRIIFTVVAVAQFIAVAVFTILGDSTPEEWSKHSWDPSAGRRLVSVDQIDFHNNEECGFLEMKIVKK